MIPLFCYKKPCRECDETLIEQDLSARPLCNPPAISCPEGCGPPLRTEAFLGISE